MTMKAPLQALNYPEAELVLGIVAPVGTDLERFQILVESQLKNYGYKANPIRLSRILHQRLKSAKAIDSLSEYERGRCPDDGRVEPS
jgi:hypothetical protein